MTKPTYTPADLARFRADYADTEFLVHVLGPDMTIVADDENRPFTLYEADRLARRVNEARNPLSWQYATVFHYGRPLAAPEGIEAAPAFNAEELAWALETWSGTEWVAFVHGMDDSFDRRNEGDPLFTEETIRKFVADMARWGRQHVAEGLSSSPVTVLHYGVPFDLNTASAVAR